MGLGNQARAQMRRPGGLRVACASFFAALYLALPIGSTAQGTRPRPAVPLDAIPRSSTRFGRSAWCRFREATLTETRSRRCSGRSSRILASGRPSTTSSSSSAVRGIRTSWTAISAAKTCLNRRSSGRGLTPCRGGSRWTMRTPPCSSARFASERDVPAGRRTRVLLGDPPIDWENSAPGRLPQVGSPARLVSRRLVRRSCSRATGAR